MHINHEEYYRDRLTERDLCFDFPGDELLIDGLHAMQTHFWTHNVPVDIPVVRVMNTAHFLAAYMFTTTCSGDRMEYDALAYGSIGHDKKLILVTMIVLAAMLERTEGYRARNCRDLIISGRGEDFEEGLTLYERFLRSREKRFAEEDFLIDTNTQIQKLVAQNEQLTAENKALKIKYQNMEKQQNTQYNNCIVYNAPVYNTTTTTNNYYPQPQAEKVGTGGDLTWSEKEQAGTTKNSPNNAAEYEKILPIPRKGKYSEVRQYIEERCRFDEEFKTFVANHSRVELCMRLTNEFGWYVDEHSLGVNMNRNR